MTEQSILELRKIHKVFDQDLLKKAVAAVDDLSCQFPLGQCTGLMGHNGAGKTTTIRLIFGLMRPDRGEVIFRGHPINRQDKRHIGYMPETNRLPATLNPVEILRHQLRLYRPDSIPRSHYSAAIENKLKEVGLWSHRQKKVKQMSKGMGRRVAWAQATIHEPDLLILDEPFSGMDPLGRQLMSELITQYKTKQKTIILCTHELGTVNEVCDHLHILNQGKLVYSSVNDTEGPRHAGYQLNLSGCTVQDLSSRKDQVGVEGWDWHEESGYAVKLWFREYRQAAQWLEFCLREGLIVTSFHKTRGFQEDELLRYFTGDKSA